MANLSPNPTEIESGVEKELLRQHLLTFISESGERFKELAMYLAFHPDHTHMLMFDKDLGDTLHQVQATLTQVGGIAVSLQMSSNEQERQINLLGCIGYNSAAGIWILRISQETEGATHIGPAEIPNSVIASATLGPNTPAGAPSMA